MNPLPGLGEGRRLRRGEGWMLSLFLLLILCGDAYYSVRAFVAHLRSEAVYYQFEAGATELARQANALLGRGWVGGWGELHSSPQAAVLMARRFWRGWPSLPYLVQEGAGLTVLTKSGKLPEGAAAPTSPAVALLWPFEDNARALAALPVGRIAVTEGAYERGDLDAESRPLYIVVRVDPAPAPAGEPSGVWADGTALTGYALTPREGQRLQVQLVWQASGAPVTAATVFRHALCDGRLVGQLDGPPAGGHYPREAWRAGDWVEDEATISLDRAWSPGICLVEIGWYDGASGTRLALRQTALPHEESALTLR